MEYNFQLQNKLDLVFDDVFGGFRVRILRSMRALEADFATAHCKKMTSLALASNCDAHGSNIYTFYSLVLD